MLPTILTAPMMPMRLYLDKVLESCLRITMCMSSWGGGVGVSDEVNEKNEEASVCVKVNLDVRALLLRTEGQPAEEVEESADLLQSQVVHVVQNSLHQVLVNHAGETLRL